VTTDGVSIRLTPYTMNLYLQALSLIYTIYSSPLHTLGLSVFTSSILVTELEVSQ
jgi:hypothetical protein